MTKIVFSFCFLLLIAVGFSAPGQPSLKAVSLCDVLKNPTDYHGKIIRIRALVNSDWEYLDVWDPNCQEQAITIAYPDDLTVQPKPPFALRKDEQYDLFKKLVNAKRRPPISSDQPSAIDLHDDPTLASPLYDVQATLTGRFDSGDIKGKKGQIIHARTFGQMNEYHARLVLHTIENVIGLPREPRHETHPVPK